jgi:hypothetical protein
MEVIMQTNEDAYLDDDDMVPDGGSVKVPIYLMDGVQRSIAANSHGQLSDELLQLRARTRAAYDQQLTNAWRSPPAGSSKQANNGNTVKPFIDADPQRRRMAAYDQMCRTMSEAWRPKLRDQEPDDDPDEPDPNAANEVQRQQEIWQGRDPSDIARDVERRRRWHRCGRWCFSRKGGKNDCIASCRFQSYRPVSRLTRPVVATLLIERRLASLVTARQTFGISRQTSERAEAIIVV